MRSIFERRFLDRGSTYVEVLDYIAEFHYTFMFHNLISPLKLPYFLEGFFRTRMFLNHKKNKYPDQPIWDRLMAALKLNFKIPIFESLVMHGVTQYACDEMKAILQHAVPNSGIRGYSTPALFRYNLEALVLSSLEDAICQRSPLTPHNPPLTQNLAPLNANQLLVEVDAKAYFHDRRWKMDSRSTAFSITGSHHQVPQDTSRVLELGPPFSTLFKVPRQCSGRSYRLVLRLVATISSEEAVNDYFEDTNERPVVKDFFPLTSRQNMFVECKPYFFIIGPEISNHDDEEEGNNNSINESHGNADEHRIEPLTFHRDIDILTEIPFPVVRDRVCRKNTGDCTCLNCVAADDDLKLMPPEVSHLLEYEFPPRPHAMPSNLRMNAYLDRDTLLSTGLARIQTLLVQSRPALR